MRRQPAKSSNKKSSTSLGVNEVGFCSLSASRIEWQMIENGLRCLEVN
ncbi:unnamed protein product [Brassica oleracea]|uniref:Uncharacterized protein n=1 Tax=Brassica oleracea TaxID=3712 RepID=A0A3P6ENY4_BRAOL|nr:unnamed protein product [Brassica oleracea]